MIATTQGTPKASNNLLSKRLMTYSMMAGAVLAHGASRAAVIKTSPNDVLDANGETFNVIFGGQTKFQIQLQSSKRTSIISTMTPTSYPYQNHNTHRRYNITNSSYYTTTTTTTTSRPGPGMSVPFSTRTYQYANVGVIPQTGNAGFANSSTYAKALNNGATVNSLIGFRNTGNALNMASYGYWGTAFGQFLGTTGKYLGLRFQIQPANTTHYGWVQVDVNYDASQALINTQAWEDSPGLGIIAGSDVSLPVEMTGLTACSAPEGVMLAWKTESEENHLGFVVERRLAESLPDAWEKIASYETHPELAGHGNRSSQTQYEFMDVNVEPDQTYLYRISDVNNNGNREKEMIIQVQYTAAVPAELALYQNYPNPFNPGTTIRFALPEKKQVKLTIYNVNGQRVESLIDKEMGIGEHRVMWNGSDFGAGLYFSELIVGDKRLVRKMHLIK